MESTEKIRVLIVDDIAETRDNLRKLIQFEPDIEVVGQAGTGEEGVELTKEKRPHVVLMDINMPGLDGISASEIITRETPASQVIMMSVQGESDYIRRSMLAGARDFLTKPFSSDELIATIHQVYERSRKVMVQPAGPIAAAAVAAPPPRQGRIIAVFSPKGGVGCSVIAANLGVVLAQAGKDTVVVDANLSFGDMGVLLNLTGTHSLVDIAERFEELDTDLISSVLATHDSGLKALLPPPSPEMGEMITAQHLQETLSLLCGLFDYVIVDTSTSLQDVMLTVLDQADKILLIATPDIPCVKNMRLFFEVIDQLDYERGRVMLVLNRVDRHAGISPSDIENTIKHSVTVSIPADHRTVMFSVNRGVPFVLREPGKPVSEAIFELASELRGIFDKVRVPEADRVAAPGGRSRLSRLFGSR
ncbi:MAG: response regulator [Anaerolineales bacterium]|nr:response regulator [Anaerolineales bacterium]